MTLAKDLINVGLIGYKFMGKAHSFGFVNAPMMFPDIKAKPVLKAIVGRDEPAVREAMEQYGWQSFETDYKKLIARDDIDLVDIATGNNVHAEIAIAAAEAGKDIFCEKPLAMNVPEARQMLDAVEKAGVKHMVNFNYRAVPAVALAKKMIDDGMIGRIFHWRSVYLQDWIIDPDFPLVWRLQKDIAGSGSLGDLAAHSIDLANWLVGDIDEVSSNLTTFIKKRPKLAETTGGLSAKGGADLGDVTVDDAIIALTKFKNGAIGTIEATRFAAGNRNGNRFEINGDKGSIRFNVERLNELEYFNREDPDAYQGWRTISVTEGIHPYVQGWWPAGHIIGWGETFVHQVVNLMNALADNEMPTPNFRDGLKVQTVLEAIEKSAESGRWEKVVSE
ncbi:MAG TPA: Gfo/Idh/MocA family oxidoreductase [Armatimonadota bacterium]|nr:Gfo/Idh/MocA family oxidoreductase [Armatimonadota bacterium]HPP75200.1 Gfo/Idh/MocA family oxidoreductase [Armatimonadota bacterium]